MKKRGFNVLLISIVGIAVIILYLFYSKIGIGSAQLESDPALVMLLTFDSNFTRCPECINNCPIDCMLIGKR